jgi:protein-ribulosamine 3-kinase
MIPADLENPVTQILRLNNDKTPIRSARDLGGGCINNAMRLDTGQGTYLLKWNPDPLPQMFYWEVRGLEMLAQVGAVRVPTVLGYSEAKQATSDQPAHPAFIVLEWLEGSSQTDEQQFMLGAQLATLHHLGKPPDSKHVYGLEGDNYIGSTRQLNGWYEDWPTFFAERRLLPQMELAAQQGKLPSTRRKSLERLIDRLPDLLTGVNRQPSLIHGDLWSGNVLPAQNGLAVIDPAVYYADREAEIALTELFSGFSPRFYEGYNSAWPLEPGYTQRRDIYNLYHLLNHLNLFGESYGSQVDAVLRRYGA